MRRKAIPVGIVLLLAVLSTTAALADGICTNMSAKGPGSVLVGTVTTRDGTHFSIRTDDGRVYTVDADKARIVSDRTPKGLMSIGVGDRLRVYGVVDGDLVCASRLRILRSEPPAVRVPPPAPPIAEGAGPALAPKHHDEIYAVGDSLGSWRSRGLVLGVHYRNKLMTIATSSGPFNIDASGATVIEANRSISLAKVSQGDAVRVWGDVTGLHKIRADRIEVLRDIVEQEAAVPAKNASITGQIDYIDYPSFTFRIDTGSGQARVMVDESTYIQFQGNRKAFMDLGVGQKVKVYGFGNLGSGFVASRIQIVGDPGR